MSLGGDVRLRPKARPFPNEVVKLNRTIKIVAHMSDLKLLLGIEIGGTKLQLVLGDATGRIHERRRLVRSEERRVGKECLP